MLIGRGLTSQDAEAVRVIDPDDLLSAFRKGFRIVHFQDVLAQPDWGPPSKRRVVRLVAERVQ